VLALAALLAGARAESQELSGADPEVTLVSPGRPPLKALRYHAKVGARGTFVTSMTMRMAMTAGGKAMPAASNPEMRFTASYEVTAVTPEGDMRYRFEFVTFEAVPDPSVPPAVVEATNRALASLKGLRGRARVSPRGITSEAEFDIPEAAPAPVKSMLDGMRQALRQFSAPLPEQPVGPGARWDIKTRITQAGMTVEQVGHNELTSLEGDRGRLAITLAQTAGAQQVAAPGMPPGSRIDLVSLSSTGGGEMVFDLSQLAPASAQMKMAMAMKMRVKVADQPAEDFETKADMTMSLTGR
jgi:hypothetical protein